MTIAAAGAGGCITTYEDEQAAALREQQLMMRVQEQNRALSGRIEGLELEIQRLGQAAEAAKTEGGRANEARLRAMEGQIEGIQRRLNELSAAREKDKQAIIDDVSRKVADLIRRTDAGSRPRGGTTGTATPRRSGSQVGYEHEVKPGETLSAIAQAYGVSQQVLMQENNIHDARLLKVGQKLFIPKSN